MNKIRISAVSYTNTKPFIYGIEHSPILQEIDLSLDIPTDCAAKVIDGTVDIGLIPVAAIPLIADPHIISDYCIGSVGAVNSVFIFSHLPVEDIRTLRLDAHSRTSNNLSRVLLKFHFKKDVSFTTEPDAVTDAIVLIGDRTFGQKDKYPYVYDMGEEWMTFTGLPFVYAAWVANKKIDAEFIAAFNRALKKGLDSRKEVIKGLPEVSGFDMEDYLMHKLDFELTAAKREALQLFLNYIAAL
ncbi:menaquinone biosynthetic enzyme MqnA/MqnD family protein [Pedobacter antarcticus]|uniref:Chorismate dehydratase n=2 Tax=Pedobacter antarcticus TaxID=34086 RepID=A0A081PD28_9SPHI|nr:menaquinone biosynthesis protein [Pedobacter antarcticus]KEQ28601.1 radical SAM protein [Pedobacter antarcticus 4BY]SDL48388.1 chorismate dehydratase [Pedobacter antarcticus]SFE36789.1 chorismate dehydratase [Pedobacter antarcticus]